MKDLSVKNHHYRSPVRLRMGVHHYARDVNWQYDHTKMREL